MSTPAADPTPNSRRAAAVLAVGVALALVLIAVGLRQEVPAASGLMGERVSPMRLAEVTPRPSPDAPRRSLPPAGKRSLIHFWGPSCGPCVRQADVIAALHSEGRASGDFEVITVASEAAVEIRSFMRRMAHDYPVLHDPAGKAMAAWRVAAIPTDYVVDSDGTVRWEGHGPSSLETLRAALAK